MIYTIRQYKSFEQAFMDTPQRVAKLTIQNIYKAQQRGLVVAGPLVFVDAVFGLGNFQKYLNNQNIDRANQISQGNYSPVLWFPGRSLK